MAWLFGQVFLLCVLSFLLGSLVTWLFVARQRRIETGRAVRTVTVGESGETGEEDRAQAVESERGGDKAANGLPKRFIEPAGGPGPEVLPSSMLPTEGSSTPAESDADAESVRLTYAVVDGEPTWHQPAGGEREKSAPNGNGKHASDGDGQHTAPLASVPAQTRGPVDGAELPATNSGEPRMVVPGPYRNSARPSPDGTAPGPGYLVKGNQKSKLYHTSDSPYFARTKATVWFQTETDAKKAGFTSSSVRRSSPVR
ncbi:sunset domain-containing protein [Actinoalloteichus hymeniacidonis]|uniref:Membrane protein ArfC n=1 Tax=Actinoalloteichus hymeniacidonis TaxID=340345 RepID=A0AAC9HUQ7_9PSEU|nr:hypothetical protein [Actinoalloteichus hymeniacidonis]AOS65808.1 hypothetical protein TL08_25150 [Actinoalloteichus hymeniacidonis]MBB5906101.1 hypothetical protein [Actinoalloteichus hymeniacidonis]